MFKSMRYIYEHIYSIEKLCLRSWILMDLETKEEKIKLRYARERIKSEGRKKGNIL